MRVTLHIPDDIAKRLSAPCGDVSRRALEALALEGYRERALTPYLVSEMPGLSRVWMEDSLGQLHVPLKRLERGEKVEERAQHVLPLQSERSTD